MSSIEDRGTTDRVLNSLTLTLISDLDLQTR